MKVNRDRQCLRIFRCSLCALTLVAAAVVTCKMVELLQSQSDQTGVDAIMMVSFRRCRGELVEQHCFSVGAMPCTSVYVCCSSTALCHQWISADFTSQLCECAAMSILLNPQAFKATDRDKDGTIGVSGCLSPEQFKEVIRDVTGTRMQGWNDFEGVYNMVRAQRTATFLVVMLLLALLAATVHTAHLLTQFSVAVSTAAGILCRHRRQGAGAGTDLAVERQPRSLAELR